MLLGRVNAVLKPYSLETKPTFAIMSATLREMSLKVLAEQLH